MAGPRVGRWLRRIFAAAPAKEDGEVVLLRDAATLCFDSLRWVPGLVVLTSNRWLWIAQWMPMTVRPRLVELRREDIDHVIVRRLRAWSTLFLLSHSTVELTTKAGDRARFVPARYSVTKADDWRRALETWLDG